MPVQVSKLTGIIQIVGGSGVAYAVDSQGRVWTWGDQSTDEIGNGTGDDATSVPVQVSKLTGITQIAAGTITGYALNSQGQIWGWGDGSADQLGSSGGWSVPVQVNDLTGITQIAAAGDTGYALRR